MRVFAISDLHLSGSQPKPMDIFGCQWQDYTQRIRQYWTEMVCDEDIVVIAGDISWAMKLEDAKQDLDWINSLPGKKVIIRGNHDYWWNSLTKVRNAAKGMCVIQNDAIRLDNYVFCGCRGWLLPGNKDFTSNDMKIYQRELLRLKMGLDSAKRLCDDQNQIIVVFHYPPITNDDDPDERVEQLLLQYNVKTVIYGHIHGKQSAGKIVRESNGIKYYLTSCDLLDFIPIQIF